MEFSGEIHALHHTAQHCNSKGSGTWGGEQNRKTRIISGERTWNQLLDRTVETRPPSLAGKKKKQALFWNQCPSNTLQLVTLLQVLRGFRTTRCVRWWKGVPGKYLVQAGGPNKLATENLRYICCSSWGNIFVPRQTKIRREKDKVLCFLQKIWNKTTHLRANICCVPMRNWKRNGEILMLYIGYLGWKALILKVTSLMKSRQFYVLVASTVGTSPGL